MFRRALLVLVLLPIAANAQGTERYLPSGSQIVVQVDPYQKTKAAYERTVKGQLMQGDTGKALKAYYNWLVKAAENAAEQHGIPSKDDIALIKDGIKLLERLSDEGLALGIEIKQAWPIDGRVVVVLPKLAAGQPNIVKLLNDLRAKAPGGAGDSKEQKIGNRTITTAELPMASLGWWSERDDFILTIGTGPVADFVKAIDAGKTGLADNATYKKLLDVGAFPTRNRAFVDMPSLVKLADKFSNEASQTVDELGLRGLGPILSISGYDGPAQRTITEIETIAARKGLVALVSPKKISLADLPPMPSDLTSFAAASSSAGEIYTVMLDIAEKVGKIYVPDQVDNVKESIKGFEDIIGVDLRKDLFGSFDNVWVQYSSPSEGLGLSGTMLFKVKDEAKLKATIKSVVAAAPQLPGIEGFRKKVYRGVEYHEFHANTPGTFSVQCFCVHKGYFVYASYPQAIQGYILRTEGVLPSWKADERLMKAFAPFPKEFTGVSFSDPRPGAQTVIAALPAVFTAINGFTMFVPGLEAFDISQIPHAQLATRDLFPNVSVTTDDGKKIRFDHRSSIGW